VVLRQSCIYGPRQFGVEDQGWVAWFVIAAILNKPIVIYGDGKQVRDILHIDDLLDFYEIAIEQIDVTGGQIYNVGGGPDNTLSIWREFNPMLERLIGRPIPITEESWRPGDQRVFISDIRKAYQDLNWQPKVGTEQGIQNLVEWVRENQDLFRESDANNH
jgi:CDP-paratose 2-epimerase